MSTPDRITGSSSTRKGYAGKCDMGRALDGAADTAPIVLSVRRGQVIQ